MIAPQYKELLGQLGATAYGKALIEFLNEEEARISDVRNSKSWEEALGNQIALGVLDKLFAFMGEKRKANRNPHQYT